jgi:hypothetical protein
VHKRSCRCIGKAQGGDKKKNRAEEKQERRDYRKVVEVVEERRRSLKIKVTCDDCAAKLSQKKR